MQPPVGQGDFVRITEHTLETRLTEDGFIRVIEQYEEDIVNTNANSDHTNNELICDRTGFRVSVDEGLVTEWTGAMVRRKSYESRHPQDFVRSKPEHPRGSPRPQQPDVFITDTITITDLDP